jgi:methylmalonic acid semialdehyde dehydrogenase
MATEGIRTIDNWINGSFVPPSTGQYLDVTTPYTGEVIAKVALSNADDVEKAVAHAKKAFQNWGTQTVKARATLLIRSHALLEKYKPELVEIVVKEHGKNRVEAQASIDKGLETLEYAMSLPQLVQGKILEVSRGVHCQDRRDPLGIVASVVPFNFPFMVPFWTLPIALATGNCMILKPSEKVPLTMNRVVEIFKEAGIPDGVLQIVNGTAPVVEALCDHPQVAALTFVGTTRVAEILSKRCRNLNKRVLALGGAKNHLIAAPDCDVSLTAADVTSSFSGCAGQRCMAASVLLTIGEQSELVSQIVAKSKAILPGSNAGQMGPVIDQISKDKIIHYIDEAEKGGASILVDGRSWGNPSKASEPGFEIVGKGFWVGPTVILHNNKSDPALHDEIFGPVLSIYVCASKEEAIEIENACPYGNAACIYTSSGAVAEWFTKRFTAAMLGINIGIPVPREPFSFGGMGTSKFGDNDITGDGGVEFFTLRKKITSKWGVPQEKNWMN